jgi:DNA-directed RNA polymerase subunit RPC12/RpoP
VPIADPFFIYPTACGLAYSMNVTYNCPGCGRAARQGVFAESRALDCPHCHQQVAIPGDTIEGRRINRCLVCPSRDLYARKDFPQRLGVALVAFGFIGSSIAWANYHVLWTFAILFGTALVDLLLYIVMGESLTCYRCGAQYRGFEEIELHGGFDLETHERYRQMAARLKNNVPSTSPQPQEIVR